MEKGKREIKNGSKFAIKLDGKNLKRHKARMLNKSDIEWLKKN